MILRGGTYKKRLSYGKVAFLLFFITLIQLGYSQSLNLGFLFKPGIALGMESMAESNYLDSSSMYMSKYRMQLNIPLKTKVNFNFRESNVKGHQTLISASSNIRQTTHKESPYDNAQTQTHSLGITSLRAGLKSGVWLYSGTAYVSESSNSFSNPTFNAFGYITKIKSKKLSFIYLYGAAFGYNFNAPIGFPILGFSKRINPEWRVTLIAPLRLTVNHKISRSLSLDIGSIYNGFNPIMRAENNQLINFRQLKNRILLNAKLGKVVTTNIEIGYGIARKLRYTEDNKLVEDHKVLSDPYIAFGLHFKLGKSLFDYKYKGFD